MVSGASVHVGAHLAELVDRASPRLMDDKIVSDTCICDHRDINMPKALRARFCLSFRDRFQYSRHLKQNLEHNCKRRVGRQVVAESSTLPSDNRSSPHNTSPKDTSCPFCIYPKELQIVV